MAKKKRKSGRKGKGGSGPLPGRKGIEWNLLHVLGALVIGFGLGGAFGYQVGSTGGANITNEGEVRTDAYGRSPGDPHFGHDHP